MTKNIIFNCYKKYILLALNKKYVSKRNKRYNNEYYLKHIIYVLENVANWKSLNLIFKDKHTDNHFKTISNMYRKMCKDGIFEIAFFDFLKENYFKLSKITKDKSINMFIDVTKINNMCGNDNIGLNCEYKKKFITALQIICDQKGIPIGIDYLKENKKDTKNKNLHKLIINDDIIIQKNIDGVIEDFIENNKTKISVSKFKKCMIECNKIKKNKINVKSNFVPKIIRKTLEHEIMGVQSTLNSIPFKIKKNMKVNLIGDKGYITNNSFTIFGKNINIITPKRKNQKKTNNLEEKALLKDRHKIENFFVFLKRKTRINVRKDKKIINYMSFVYIALIEYLFIIANKLKITVLL